jgi:hypothetical protein
MQPNKEAIRCFLNELYITSKQQFESENQGCPRIFKRQWPVILFQKQLSGF